MKLIQSLVILILLSLITGLTGFCQETTGGRWLNYSELEVLTYYAEKGKTAEKLVPEQRAQIDDLLEKSEIHESKISDLNTFNGVLTSDNTILREEVRKSKQKNQILKVLSISFGAIATIEVVVLIISLN